MKIAKIAQLLLKFRPEVMAHIFKKVCRTHSHVSQLMRQLSLNVSRGRKKIQNLGKEDDFLNPLHRLKYKVHELC